MDGTRPATQRQVRPGTRLTVCGECEFVWPLEELVEVELLSAGSCMVTRLCPDCLRAHDANPEAAPAHRPGRVAEFSPAERAARLLGLGYSTHELRKFGFDTIDGGRQELTRVRTRVA